VGDVNEKGEQQNTGHRSDDNRAAEECAETAGISYDLPDEDQQGQEDEKDEITEGRVATDRGQNSRSSHEPPTRCVFPKGLQ
jgi:hypothetical protein